MTTARPEPEEPDGSAADDARPGGPAPGEAPGADGSAAGGGPSAGEPFPVGPASPGAPAGRARRSDLSDEDVDHRFAALTKDFAELPGLDRRVVRSPVTDDLVQVGPRDHAPSVDEDDEEGYEPPDPEVHVADRRRVVAWALVVAPVVVALALILSGQYIGPLLISALGACVFGGAVWLVTLLPQQRDDDDSGAVV